MGSCASNKGRKLGTASIVFPLTPALSPSAGEREQRRQSLDIPGHAGFADGLPRVLPLPRRGGEGRGEGKGTLRTQASGSLGGRKFGA